MTRNPAEMTAYASLYPGVMHMPTTLPRIDRYGHAWCWCGVRNGRAVGGDAQCDECRNRPKPKHAHITYGHGVAPVQASPVDHFHDCSRCGQVVITRQDPPVCQTCRKLEREPQGETVRLFEPAPAQLEGQLTF